MAFEFSVFSHVLYMAKLKNTLFFINDIRICLVSNKIYKIVVLKSISKLFWKFPKMSKFSL